VSKERVLITVKTYPTLSTKYGELVCTAGIRESTGEWIRIYPIPYRRFNRDLHFKKYQWVNIQLKKNPGDPRSESYRPVNLFDIELQEVIPTGKNEWNKRKEFVLNPDYLYTSLDDLLLDTKMHNRSIAVFKPAKYIRFSIESTSNEWDPRKLEACKAILNQPGFFDEDLIRQTKPVDKIPYKFKIKFADETGRESEMMVEDWEIGSLYRNCTGKTGDEDKACRDVRFKIETLMNDRDLYLILGTTAAWHYIAPNPYLIIGLFYPPFSPSPSAQMSLEF